MYFSMYSYLRSALVAESALNPFCSSLHRSSGLQKNIVLPQLNYKELCNFHFSLVLCVTLWVHKPNFPLVSFTV